MCLPGKSIKLLMCALLCTSFAVSTALAGPQQKPNIIFIMADDLGWRDVGYAGAEFFETPNIDRMASMGMVFRDAYSGGPNCAPTRACLMTGTYTPRHHIYTPGGQAKGNPAFMKLFVPAKERKDRKLNSQAAKQFEVTNQLNPDFVCIPEVLKDAGYVSARLGKWHLGTDTQGFDLSSSDGEGGPGGSFYGEVDVAEKLTDRAIQFMEENKEGPFFLYLAHWDVHTPHKAYADVVKRYEEKLKQVPVGQRMNIKPEYAGMIEAVDKSVGRVLKKVEELGIGRNTLIVFTSDNGGMSSVSQLDPLRGEKGSLFEAGVRVPCIMLWDGHIQPGSISATPITSVDYLPTFARLSGAPLPNAQPVDGDDLSPLMEGKAISERSIFWHYPLYLRGRGLAIELTGGRTYSWRGFPSTSLRRGDYKLVEFHETDTVALYNLRKDPAESRDLAKQMPELTAKLRAELDAWQAQVDAPVPNIPNPEYDLSAKIVPN